MLHILEIRVQGTGVRLEGTDVLTDVLTVHRDVTSVLPVLTRYLVGSVQPTRLTTLVASIRAQVRRQGARSHVITNVVVSAGILVSKHQIDTGCNGRMIRVLDRHISVRCVLARCTSTL